MIILIIIVILAIYAIVAYNKKYFPFNKKEGFNDQPYDKTISYCGKGNYIQPVDDDVV
jgi:hypothetical protein